MPRSRHVLAYDLGTTGNKATLFDATGTSAAAISKDYETAYPHPGWAEQDTELVPLFQETYRALEPLYERLGRK